MFPGKIFRFDRAIQKAVSWQLSQQKDFALSDDLKPKELLQLFSPEFLGECEKGAGKQIPVSKAIYYLLLEHRRFMPSFYPPHDICLSLANLANMKVKARSLLVLEPRFLPVAVLLAGNIREIALPTALNPLKEMLGAYLKNISFMNLPEKPIKNALILAGDPRVCLEDGKGDYLREAEDAICLTNWDFLGVKKSESYRRYWMEKSGVAGILQLPRLKRQGSSAYPAILRLHLGASPRIRMGRIDTGSFGLGALNQEQVISLMYGEPDGVNSQDIEKKKINANPGCNLTPALWLKSGDYCKKENGTRLAACVQIIRCQLKRVKLPETSDNDYGQQGDGSFIVREVGMGALESQCGILLDGCGETVKIDFKRRNSQFKYLLRRNDLIFAFRGTTESLGKVGFVEWEPTLPAITGTAFYLLRPLADINPVWLFWQLQSKDLRNEILSRSTGTTMLNISVDDIGSLPIRQPKPEELASILALHSEMAHEVAAISTAMRKISHPLEQIRTLIATKKEAP